MNKILKLKSVTKRQWILAGASAAVMLGCFLALYFTLGKELLHVITDQQAFKAWLDGFSVPANVMFVFVRAFQTVIKIIPAEPLEIGSGYVWGTMNKILKLKSVTKRQWILAGASAAVMLGCFLALYFTLGKELLHVITDQQAFKAWLDGFSVPANVMFVFVRAFQTVIKIIPAEPLEIGSGYVWGTFGGFFYCMLGTEIGSLIILALTKAFGVKFVEIFVDIKKINEWSFLKNAKRKYLLLFVIYLIPGTPKDIITYFIGLTDTKFLPFLIITGIARIPAILSSTYCGSRLIDNNYTLFIAVFAVITIVSAAGTYFGMKYMKKLKEKETRPAANALEQ